MFDTVFLIIGEFMNSEIMPYSNIVFPTVKKIFDVLDREKAHVKILLKHETVIEFLQKFELTVDFYFKAEKKDITVDCNILDWEKCAKKIESLFLIKSGDPEKLQFDEFYVRIKDKFHANGFEKYAHCLDVPEDRLAYVTKRKSGIEFNSIMDLIIKKMQTSQVIPVNLNDSEELLLQHILIDLKN